MVLTNVVLLMSANPGCYVLVKPGLKVCFLITCFTCISLMADKGLCMYMYMSVFFSFALFQVLIGYRDKSKLHCQFQDILCANCILYVQH